MQRWDLVVPTEQNRFCLFAEEFETNPLVLFHATPKRHFNSIVTLGFRSAADLGVGTLTSVSYARQSSSCLAHLGNEVQEDYVVFAVSFDTLQALGIVENASDIHVYKLEIQPKILEVPPEFRLPRVHGYH
jgi:hypothetical protein